MHKLLQVTSRVLAFSLPIALVGSFANPANALVTSFGTSDGNEDSLQTILNERIEPDIDVNKDQNDFEFFTNDTSSNLSTTSMVLEFAGNQNNNLFGIYNSSLTKATVFYGAATEGSFATLSFASNDLKVDTVDENGDDISETFSNFGDNFGFFLTSKNGDTFFSQSSLNVDNQLLTKENKGDFMASYQGQGDPQTLDIDGTGTEFGSNTFRKNEFILAWEDLPNGDGDYNDMVVQVAGVKPVPEPFTVLGSVTALGVGGFLKRKYGKKA